MKFNNIDDLLLIMTSFVHKLCLTVKIGEMSDLL